MIQVYLYSLIVHVCEQAHQSGNNRKVHFSMGYFSPHKLGQRGYIAQPDVIKNTIFMLVMRSSTFLNQTLQGDYYVN